MGGVFFVIVVAAFVFRPHEGEKEDIESKFSENKILDYIRHQDGIFRVHTMESTGIDTSIQHYSMPMKIQTIFGFHGNIWLSKYFNEYLTISHVFSSRFWGLLNTRYITSQTAINDSNFVLVDTFEICQTCLPARVNGPYLYENKAFLPRAYAPKISGIIISNDLLPYYQVLADLRFDPASVNLLIFPSLDNVSEQVLRNADFVLLMNADAHSLTRNSQKIKKVSEKLVPNVFEGKTTITENDFNKTLFLRAPLREVQILSYTNNKIVLNTSGISGFVVLSEKFYVFDKNVIVSNGEKLFRANGVSTAVWVDDEETLTFEYYPRGFAIGLWLLLGSIVLFIGAVVVEKRIKKNRLAHH